MCVSLEYRRSSERLHTLIIQRIFNVFVYRHRKGYNDTGREKAYQEC